MVETWLFRVFHSRILHVAVALIYGTFLVVYSTCSSFPTFLSTALPLLFQLPAHCSSHIFSHRFSQFLRYFLTRLFFKFHYSSRCFPTFPFHFHVLFILSHPLYTSTCRFLIPLLFRLQFPTATLDFDFKPHFNFPLLLPAPIPTSIFSFNFQFQLPPTNFHLKFPLSSSTFHFQIHV